MRAFKSYGIALILVAVAAFWLGSGVLVQGGKGPELGETTVLSHVEKDGGPITNLVDATGIAREVEHEKGVKDPSLTIAERNAIEATVDGPLRSVRTRHFDIKQMPLEVTLRGHTAARASVKATAQTSDIIRTIDVHEGQTVEIGDLICTLDDGTRQASVDQAQASLAQAKAALAQARSDFNTNESLRKKAIASANSAEGFAAALSAAEANFQAATVALRNWEDELANTRILATVPGVIQRPLAEVGDLMPGGGSCATIVQLDPMLFVGAVPQSLIDLAKLGIPADISTINNQKSSGKVSYISVSSNPATRSFDIEIEFPNADGKILDGLSAEAKLSLGKVFAHLLPQSIMTLDAEGTLGLRTVEDGKVVFYPIKILKDTRDGMWVTGLPASIDAIVVGQEYVTAGQSVAASAEE